MVSRCLEARGISVDTHVVVPDPSRPNDAVPFPDWARYDLIVPMGSVRSLTDRHEIDRWVDIELDLIRAAAERDQPILGVCFGGQLIAEALGGSVELAPTTEIGWYEIEPVDGQVNPVGPGPWMEWHHDRFAPPPDAVVLATTEVGPQLFRIGRIVGTQFHPEVDTEHLARWLRSVDDDYLTTYGQDRARLMTDCRYHEPGATERCRALVDWFLDEVAFA